jgi:nitrite reductase/ring-hydroxylating ferredoxin subunit/alkylhydroperoxidase/carboxymuconolactone decarboxylase family protein YurZ
MSDALNFLAKARPDAMAHYLAFLKTCGTRLDPKTRDLISVITKVHNQTERGLRQYLERALKDGCTAEEIVDALLMAFPALGLSKIVWAVDVILAMKLPEFERLAAAGDPAMAAMTTAAATTTSTITSTTASKTVRAGTATEAMPLAPAAGQAAAMSWHDVTADSLTLGEARCANVNGRGLVVYRGASGIAVYDNRCPHQGTQLEPLNIGAGEATCPKHAWRFDLATGACIDRGDRPLTKLDSRIAYGRVLARW